MDKKERQKDAPTVAPGMENNIGLGIDATEEDKRKDNTTSVTIASLDEVDPS